MNYSQIILESEQKELFIQIVEAAKKVPREERMIINSKTTTGDWLTIGGYGKNRTELEDIADGDLGELTNKRLLRLTYSKGSTQNFAITPEGFLYYEWLRKHQGKPVERVQENIFQYFEFEDFKKEYSAAYKKLKQAEELLWRSDSDANFSAIGHHCREAMQEFADTLYTQIIGRISDEPKASTVTRIRAVIKEKSGEAGKTVTAFLEALLPFWGTVSDLVQRQEHAGQKEGETINWEDARRIVFQTANVMFEFHRTLSR